ncbi:MAG: 1-acyl-sn-glycerol-3-phosphate acyltransferase [Erysipelotrichaceae bacterium]|nr:1-acyl-sn-glycerol-3-phosphate acyltransferase [Erysipelotrichaceae bacterium]
MNWIRIGRCLPLLPQAWGSSFVYSKRKTDQAYKRCRQWAQKVLKRIGMTFTVWGRSNIPEKGCLLVSNHQGTLDPVLVMASCSQPVYFIAKEGAGKLPVIGRWARNIETILFDRDTKEGNIYMLREALRRLKKGQIVLIFPEGTRSKQDAMNPFKPKSLQLAYMAKVPIVPITLNHSYCIDTKYKGKDLSITYHNPISYEEYKELTEAQLSVLVHQIIEDGILYE